MGCVAGVSALNAVCVSDLSRRIVSVSDDYASLLGYRPEDLIGISWESLNPPSELSMARLRFDRMLQTRENYGYFKKLRRADGTVIDVLARCTLLQSNDRQPVLVHGTLLPVAAEMTEHFHPETAAGCATTIEAMTEEMAVYAERHEMLEIASHLRQAMDLATHQLSRLQNRIDA